MPLPKEIALFFADYIEKEIGIIYSEQNYFQLEKRLEDIAKQLGIESVVKLYESSKIGISGQFRQLLLDLATNNETSFYRDPKVFKAIQNHIFPEFMGKKIPKVRIWSAATSFGQEPYTLSMIIKEFQDQNSLSPKFEMLGTDISGVALNKARAGVFSQLEVQRGLTALQLVKCFDKKDNTEWQIKPDYKKIITFKIQNLLSPLLAEGKFHLIFCRNVLIYQNEQRKKDIVQRMTHALEVGGYLILGAAESLLGVSEDYKQLLLEGAVVYQRKVGPTG